MAPPSAAEALAAAELAVASNKTIADKKTPEELVGTFGCYQVVTTTEAGAFLEWGFPKDLFIPSREIKGDLYEEEWHIVYIYIDDKGGRITATPRIDHHLDKTPITLVENEEVDLLIANETDLGFKAIVNNAYWGLLYRGEIFQPLKYGQRLKGFVKKVREDGKLDIILQKTGYDSVPDLAERVLAHLKRCNGRCNLSDNSSPDEIKKLFNVSKKKFKLAIGKLYKERLIILEEDGIKLVNQPPPSM